MTHTNKCAFTCIYLLIRHLAHTNGKIPPSNDSTAFCWFSFCLISGKSCDFLFGQLNSSRHMLLKDGTVWDEALSHFKVRNSVKPCDRMTLLSFEFETLCFRFFYIYLNIYRKKSDLNLAQRCALSYQYDMNVNTVHCKRRLYVLKCWCFNLIESVAFNLLNIVKCK